MKERLLKFFELVPSSLMHNAFIAGGAAVDLDRADDVDIWLVGEEDSGDLRAELKSFFVRKEMQFEEKNLDRCPDYAPTNSIVDYYVLDGYPIYQLEFQGKKVQILITKFGGRLDLLAHFDLSVHQVGYSPAGTKLTMRSTTQPGDEFRITNYANPRSTAHRIEKLEKRYGGHCNAEDVVELSKKIFASSMQPVETRGRIESGETPAVLPPVGQPSNVVYGHDLNSKFEDEEIPF